MECCSMSGEWNVTAHWENEMLLHIERMKYYCISVCRQNEMLQHIENGMLLHVRRLVCCRTLRKCSGWSVSRLGVVCVCSGSNLSVPWDMVRQKQSVTMSAVISHSLCPPASQINEMCSHSIWTMLSRELNHNWSWNWSVQTLLSQARNNVGVGSNPTSDTMWKQDPRTSTSVMI